MTVAHSRDEWLDARRIGIGASEAAAIVGMHPWVSPLGLYYDKTGEVTKQQEPPTEAMEWGLRLEPVVAQAWAEKNGRRVRRFEAYDPACMFTHPDHEWMRASLDGVVLAERGDTWDAVFECKTASGWVAEDWAEGIPPYVAIQVQWQMAVSGLPRAHVACLCGGSRYVQDVVDRDEEFIAALIAAGSRFWQRIVDHDPPTADGHPNTAAVLKARWQETLDDAVELGAEGYDLVTQRHEACRTIKAATTEKDAAENRLRQLLGDHEVGVVYGEIAATWRPTKAGTRRLIVKELT